MQSKIFFFLILLSFVAVSFSSYKWDDTKLINNVYTFAEFVDDLYREYTKDDQMKLFIKHSYNSISQQQMRTVFNLTFVKCAGEIAHFHVNNKNEHSKEQYQYLNVFVGFLHYDQSLGHKIAKKFNKEILFPEKKIAEAVVNQILQLTFSFAVRVLLSVNYDAYFKELDGIGRWQLKTILTAYENLSKENNKNNENGIFPFQISETDQESEPLWAQFLSLPSNQNYTTKYSTEQLQYIQNFKWILELSKIKLSYYEIYKLLDTITDNLGQNEKPPAIYETMEDLFTKALKYYEKPAINTNCAIIHFVNELVKFVNYGYIKEYKRKIDEKCGIKSISSKNEMFLLFNEPLLNYAEVVEIDMNTFSDGLKFCKDFQAIVPSIQKSTNQYGKTILNLKELKEFIHLHNFVRFNIFYSKHHHDKLQIFYQNMYYDLLHFYHKNDPATELSSILEQMHEDFSRANKNSKSINSRIMPNDTAKVPFKFGEILYEIFKKFSVKVKYNEKLQLFTFPLEFGEHFIQRLSAFVERNITEGSQVGVFNFIKTVQTVASMDKEMVAENRQIAIWENFNVQLFKLLFSLAIRLCLKIDRNDYLDKYLPTFLFGLKMCSKNRSELFIFFDYQLKIESGIVQINLPNWNLPYYFYLQNESELKVEDFDENFGFLRELYKHPPTIYEVINSAKNTFVTKGSMPVLIANLEKMLENGHWNCMDFKKVKKNQWVLLKNVLHKNKFIHKWTKIQKLRMECDETYLSKSLKAGKTTIIEMREEMKEMVEKLKKVKEEMKHRHLIDSTIRWISYL